MKFENDLLKPENQTHLRNALIEWCIGSDGQNGAICDILGNITWTAEMEDIMPWCDVVDEKIDDAIGARIKVDCHTITNSYKREEFLKLIDKKVASIVKAYQEAINKLNVLNSKCMVVEEYTHTDERGFTKYNVIKMVYGNSFYECIVQIWHDYGIKSNWKYELFVDACYTGSVHIKDNLYCHFGNKDTNSN